MGPLRTMCMTVRGCETCGSRRVPLVSHARAPAVMGIVRGYPIVGLQGGRLTLMVQMMREKLQHIEYFDGTLVVVEDSKKGAIRVVEDGSSGDEYASYSYGFDVRSRKEAIELAQEYANGYAAGVRDSNGA